MNLNAYLDVNPEVAAAVAAGKPVVALESTIISHGMPYPQNVETALKVERISRENGAVPATIAILGGRLKAGLSPEEIEYLLSLDDRVAECVVTGIHDEKKDDIIIVATIFPDMDWVEQNLGKDATDEQIQKELEDAVDKVNEKLVNYKKIKKTVLRKEEFEKNTSRKIKRY